MFQIQYHNQIKITIQNNNSTPAPESKSDNNSSQDPNHAAPSVESKERSFSDTSVQEKINKKRSQILGSFFIKA